MYIDFSVLSPFVPYWTLILPVLVTVLAGILRQDGLKPNVNKAITTVLVLAASVFAAFYNHALSGDVPLDMTVILGYCTAIMRIPEMRNLQSYIQSNWLNVIAAEAQKLTAVQPVQAPLVQQAPANQVPMQMQALNTPLANTAATNMVTSTFVQPMTLPTATQSTVTTFQPIQLPSQPVLNRQWTALEVPTVQPPQQG